MKKEEYRRQQKAFQRQLRLNRLATPGPYPLTMVLDHLKRDFNVGKIIRSAEAFGLTEVVLVGVPFFDPTPAKGSLKHIPVRFFDNFAECYRALRAEGNAFYALDFEHSTCLTKVKVAKKAAIIAGHEEFGLSFHREEYPEVQAVRIPQRGKVESLNVSIAASVAMYEYVRQYEEGGSSE